MIRGSLPFARYYSLARLRRRGEPRDVTKAPAHAATAPLFRRPGLPPADPERFGGLFNSMKRRSSSKKIHSDGYFDMIQKELSACTRLDMSE